jgi:phosphoserine phosphatase
MEEASFSHEINSTAIKSREKPFPRARKQPFLCVLQQLYDRDFLSDYQHAEIPQAMNGLRFKKNWPRMSSRIAIVFDFDDTLTPDSTSAYLEAQGVNVRKFWAEDVNALRDTGWDPIPAYLYAMIKLSQSRPKSKRFTRRSMQEFSKSLRFYPGAPRIFSSLRKHLTKLASDIELDFFLISSGLRDIVGHSSLSKNFADIWSCDFHCNTAGEIEFPKNVVSFTDKTRFLFQISKGFFGREYSNRPFEVNRKVPDAEVYVPMNQMIFIGDGMTDIPCFSMVRKMGGWALGIYDPKHQDQWGRAWGFVEQNRVSNLVPADYRPSSGLYHSLIMATNALVSSIQARQKSYQG